MCGTTLLSSAVFWGPVEVRAFSPVLRFFHWSIVLVLRPLTVFLVLPFFYKFVVTGLSVDASSPPPAIVIFPSRVRGLSIVP